MPEVSIPWAMKGAFEYTCVFQPSKGSWRYCKKEVG